MRRRADWTLRTIAAAQAPDRPGGPPGTGMALLDRPREAGRLLAGRPGSPRERAGGRRRAEHPVHLGNDGPAQGRDAHASQPADERLLCGPAAALHRRRPRLRAGTVLPLLRLRAGQPGLRRVWLGDRGSCSVVRPRGDARGHRARAMHLALRRAHDVRGRARAARVFRRQDRQACAPASWRARHAPCP